MPISFNVPTVTGKEQLYINEVIGKGLNSDYLKKCTEHLEAYYQNRVLLTSSCTTALEMAAVLLDIQPGDEVIVPSFSFVSTANAFVMRGATIAFVDIRPETMNMDERLIEQAITPRTKAIVPVHYSGVACNIERIIDIARQRGLSVIEDAAHCYGATYRQLPLGSFGNMGTVSFDYMKNITSAGEGGALLVRDAAQLEKAEIILHRGTNYLQFIRGDAPQYSWRGLGSSYRLSAIHAAYLWANLQEEEHILAHRRVLWRAYYEALSILAERGVVELPFIPEDCQHNAHIFFMKVRDQQERTRLLEHLHKNGIMAASHYVPLHSSKMGMQVGYFSGEDRYTTKESLRLVRLPIYHQLQLHHIESVVENILKFYN